MYRTTNIGSVTCSAQLRHVRLPVAWSLNEPPMIPDGGYGILTLPNPVPNKKVYIAGAAPHAATGGPCRWDAALPGYFSTARLDLEFHNIGSVTCGVTLTLAAL